MPILARSIQEITVILIPKSFERVVEELKQLRILKYLCIKITFFISLTPFFFSLWARPQFLKFEVPFIHILFPLFWESSSYILSICHQRVPKWAIKNDDNDVVLKILKMKQNKKKKKKQQDEKTYRPCCYCQICLRN